MSDRSSFREHPAGAILRVLRISHAYTQETLGRAIRIVPSYISRIERSDRLPSSQVMRDWLTLCPVPLLPPMFLAANLSGIQIPSKPASHSGLPDAGTHWLISARIADAVWSTASGGSWMAYCAKALRLPSVTHLVSHLVSESVHDRTLGLTALLWLVVRAAYYHRVTPDAFAMLFPYASESPTDRPWEPVEQCFTTLWDALAACPAAVAESSPRNVLFDQLTQLWPQLAVPARHAVLAAVDAFVTHADD